MMKNLLMAAFLFLLTPMGLADGHESASSGEIPIEVWACNYKDGNDISDLRALYTDFNKLSDKMENGKFSAWIWTPMFVSDLKNADVAVATAFPTLESMGQSMQEFFGGKETGKLFARYQSIVDCTSREVWMVENMRTGM